MFNTTHQSLTRYYVSVTVAIFSIMVIAFLGLMTWTMYNDQKLDAIAFAREEATEYLGLFEKNLFFIDQMIGVVEYDETVSESEIHGALRVCAVIKMPDGKIYPLTYMTKNIKNWLVEQIGQKDFSEPTLLTYNTGKNNRYRIFLVKEDIIKDGEYFGTIYAGRGVSIIFTVLKRMLLFSFLLIIIFSIVLYHFGKKIAYRAIKPIEQAVLAQKQFVTNASHELITPLSVMLAGTELIKIDNEQNLSSQNRDIIEDIQDEIRKMAKMAENLLSLSRIDENGIDIKTEEDVVKITGAVIGKMQTLAQKKDIKLTLANKEPLVCYINNGALTQILYILLDNAVKYTPQGGDVLVALKNERQTEGKLVITVEDTGIGISEEDQTHIFERFYRVDKARTNRQEGNGLGLSIAWSLLEKIGGTISVSSAAGKGTMFKVTIPLAGG